MDFWNMPLDMLSEEQWEALCDGCGRCCLHRFEDEETGEVLYTDVACRLFDMDSCRCTRYAERRRLVPECLSVRLLSADQYAWLPVTCAYRLRREGKALPAWHPLISGDAASVREAGISVRGRCVPESEVAEEEWPEHIIAPD